ncbi:hypothetical protein Save01_02479 [Streptomyces avermitilis]
MAQFEVGELAAWVLVAKQVSRSPSRSVKRNWAPGCGRSFLTISRIPFGQVVRSGMSVISSDPGAGPFGADQGLPSPPQVFGQLSQGELGGFDVGGS